MNRLAQETSPYLRQHADNPVDWWPWSPKAFEEAERRDVPVLLSVGYSACHWCHVMAHESFEDPATAAVMNEEFVNIKVDREERPDVDAIYMEAVQALTGHGGWPMTVWITPDGKPFFGGTYFPKEARGGLPAFAELCQAVGKTWRDDRTQLLDQAGKLTDSLGRMSQLTAGAGDAHDAVDPSILTVAAAVLADQFDPDWGGFGRAPKFPQAMSLDLLLRHHRHSGDPRALEMVTTTLDAMASGGMYDHLGGGFARYSVDAFWMVPHFEKMLYDQALLIRVYLHAWQLTGEDRHRQVLDETVTYVLHELRHGAGGFFSAEDADSEGEEGKFYVWRPEEIRDVLGDDADRAIEWWGVTSAGNFEGANILHRPVRGDLVRPPEIDDARRRLFEARAHRVRPGLDDKVLTEWNGLFVSALAEAGAATGTAEWVEGAEKAAGFLLEKLRDPDGRWLRSWQADGGARHRAYAADHAALADMFTRLSEATGSARWLEEAVAVADALIDGYEDTERGGFFTTAHDAEPLVTRPKDLLDNAVPSANSAGALALGRLAALTGDDRFLRSAERAVALVAGPATDHPTAFAHALEAIDVLGRPREIVVAGDRPDLVTEVHRRYLPEAVLAWGERTGTPLWEARDDGLAYVCERFACQQPVGDPDSLAAQLS